MSRHEPSTKRQEHHRKHHPVLKHDAEQAPIVLAHPIKTILEAVLQSDERTHPRRGLFGICHVTVVHVMAVKPHHQRRHQRPRQRVAGQHRKHHRLRQRHEQIPRHARQEKHRDEHDANAQRGDKRRQRDLLRAVQNRLDGRLAQRHLAVDVLQLDGRVVHQNADRQRQPAQRHQVDRLAQRAKSRPATPAPTAESRGR